MNSSQAVALSDDWLQKAGRDRDWAYFAHMTKAEGYALLTAGLPKDATVNVNIGPQGAGRIVTIIPDEITAERHFNLVHGTAGISTMRVKHQAQGNGTRVQATQLDFLAAAGVRQVAVFATDEAGGYVQSRFGALPNNPRDDRIWGLAEERYQTIRPVLEAHDRKELDHVMKGRSRTSTWRVADQRLNVTPYLQALCDQAKYSGKNQGFLSGVFTQSTVCPPRTSDRVRSVIETGTPLPLGDFLFSGTEWDGYINTENTRQMTRVDDYAKQKTGTGLMSVMRENHLGHGG